MPEKVDYNIQENTKGSCTNCAKASAYYIYATTTYKSNSTAEDAYLCAECYNKWVGGTI